MWTKHYEIGTALKTIDGVLWFAPLLKDGTVDEESMGVVDVFDDVLTSCYYLRHKMAKWQKYQAMRCLIRA